ncbi:hypothetical protein BCR34DRAFT_571097 [Clohesyomyces aquaticus]|uniref:CorA-like transporter domain-containing protein n=1 Tax=Clohesyomyces aquaticus TaxID=1231657 RepID=A0A1Y1Z912_9PLEO|nr:hypothetical protein BCR34DRAFT_571097 [Clohesyomyces aquaticus]
MSDWRDYPLSLAECDPYVYDLTYSDKLLQDHSKRLFVDDDELRIKVIEIGEPQDRQFDNFASFDEYLGSTDFRGTRIILVPQVHSWSKLLISQNGIRRLLHRFKVFPAMLDIICAFGEQTSEISDSLGGCHRVMSESVSEHCYLIKNAEKNGREDAQEPWSIRQMGVYHRHNEANEGDTFIIFNPLLSFQHRLKNARILSSPTPDDLHMLALSHCTWQFRWYLGYWESKLGDLISKAHLSEVEMTKNVRKTTLTIEYGDVQDVQVIHDRMNMAKFVLSSNLNICNSLLNDSAALFRAEILMQSSRADNLLERTRSASSLMQDILSFRGLDALKLSSENSNEMARLADIDNKNMVELTKKSQRDAQTLKKITILTMVYLPASFVSQFLSMGYIRVNSDRNPPSLVLKSEMVIFAVLTFVLLAFTVGLWRYVDSDSPRRVQSGNIWWNLRRDQATKENV